MGEDDENVSFTEIWLKNKVLGKADNGAGLTKSLGFIL